MATVEVTTFRLVPGTDEAAFLAADRVVQTELIYLQPGLARRTVARRGDEWLVVTVWATEEHAAAGAAAAEGHPLHVEFDKHLQHDSVHVARYDTFD
jgi:heme-degrading monooxygenase HmoA